MTARATRDDVREGDHVTYGSLGYVHEGTAWLDDGGMLRVGGSGQWYSCFHEAESTSRSLSDEDWARAQAKHS